MVPTFAQRWCNTPGVKNVICILIIITNLRIKSKFSISLNSKLQSVFLLSFKFYCHPVKVVNMKVILNVIIYKFNCDPVKVANMKVILNVIIYLL
jgi:hypothetical protein